MESQERSLPTRNACTQVGWTISELPIVQTRPTQADDGCVAGCWMAAVALRTSRSHRQIDVRSSAPRASPAPPPTSYFTSSALAVEPGLY
jgi:hypothetical protein